MQVTHDFIYIFFFQIELQVAHVQLDHVTNPPEAKVLLHIA